MSATLLGMSFALYEWNLRNQKMLLFFPSIQSAKNHLRKKDGLGNIGGKKDRNKTRNERINTTKDNEI